MNDKKERIVAVTQVTKHGLNDEFLIAINDIKNQTRPPDKIVVYYSTEPYWLDDGIDDIPEKYKVEGVHYVCVPNIACMRCINYGIIDHMDYDYLYVFANDCEFFKQSIEKSIYVINKQGIGLVGLKGKSINIDTMVLNDVRSNNIMEVDYLLTGGLLLRPKEASKYGVLNWYRDNPIAMMCEEIWISGCYAKYNSRRIVLPFGHKVIRESHEKSVFTYYGNVKYSIQRVMLLYFRKYWNKLDVEKMMKDVMRCREDEQ